LLRKRHCHRLEKNKEQSRSLRQPQKYVLQPDMQQAFDALIAVIAGTQGWPATAAGVERIASKAGNIVTALRNRYKTGTVEKLVFFLSNKEFKPTVEEVCASIVKKMQEQKKQNKEARQAAKAATASSKQTAAAAPALDPAAAAIEVAAPSVAIAASPIPVAQPVAGPGDASSASTSTHGENIDGMEEVDESGERDGDGEELDEDSIQALIEAIYDARADPTAEEEATAQFDDFVAEVLAAASSGEVSEEGGSF